MIDKKTVVIIILMLVAIFGGTQYYKNVVDSIDEAEQERLADIKANPQNYYVSEGGTKPDPVEPEAQPEATVE